jgi:hypothetical protein
MANRNAIVLILILTVSTSLSGFVRAVSTPPKNEAMQLRFQHAPITVVAYCYGDFVQGAAWYLSVNSAGQAELGISGREPRRFEVPAEQWKAFRAALQSERFFELDSQYGKGVPDGSKRSLTVHLGDVSKTVDVRFLMHLQRAGKDQLDEPCRILRLLASVRAWIPDPEAVDLSQYDRKILDAAG